MGKLEIIQDISAKNENFLFYQILDEYRKWLKQLVDLSIAQEIWVTIDFQGNEVYCSSKKNDHCCDDFLFVKEKFWLTTKTRDYKAVLLGKRWGDKTWRIIAKWKFAATTASWRNWEVNRPLELHTFITKIKVKDYIWLAYSLLSAYWSLVNAADLLDMHCFLFGGINLKHDAILEESCKTEEIID